MGDIARALLYFDCNMILTAVDIQEQLTKEYPKHPSVRALQSHFFRLGKQLTPISPYDDSDYDWELPNPYNQETDWEKIWLKFYNTQPIEDEPHPARNKHLWRANAWTLLAISQRNQIHPSDVRIKKWDSKVGWPKAIERPVGNHLILSGLLASINGMPIDLGFPADIDFNHPNVKRLLEN